MSVELAKFAVAVIASLMGNNPPGHTFNDHHERLTGVAGSMAAVSSAEPLYDGPNGDMLSVVTLAVTAKRESGFDERVQTCARKGDRGRSITLYQLMKPWALKRYVTVKNAAGKIEKRLVTVHTEQQICSNQDIAAGQALHIIGNIQRNNYSTPLQVFQAYVTGSYAAKLRRVAGRCYEWQRTAKRFGLRDERGSRITRISCYRRPRKIVTDHDAMLMAVTEWTNDD